MQTLRRARDLARLMVAWFVLSLGVAVASPLVAPQDMVLVCSSTGAMKVVLKSDGSDAAGQAGQGGHTLDCPLCAALGAPPPTHDLNLSLAQPLGHVLQSIPAARMAALTAAPLPPRGPPARA